MKTYTVQVAWETGNGSPSGIQYAVKCSSPRVAMNRCMERASREVCKPSQVCMARILNVS